MPFGTVSDIRVYPYIIKEKQVELLSNYHEDLEFDMADKYLSNFVEQGIISLILLALNDYCRSDTKCNIIRVLTYLANHRDCKAYILKYNGLNKALDMTTDSDAFIVYEALKLS